MRSVLSVSDLTATEQPFRLRRTMCSGGGSGVKSPRGLIYQMASLNSLWSMGLRGGRRCSTAVMAMYCSNIQVRFCADEMDSVQRKNGLFIGTQVSHH
jgi:hypothetical protein